EVTRPGARYPTRVSKRAFYDALLARVRALPGVVTAGLTDTVPVTGGGSVQPGVVEGRPELKPSEQPTVAVRGVSADYFRTMGIPILRGRDVASSDRDAMLVSTSAAKLLWGEQNPVGSRVTLPLMSRTTFIDVVGLTGDVRETLAETAPPTVYYYKRELPHAYFSLTIRTPGDPAAMGKSAEAPVHAIDPQLPVVDIRSMQDVIDESLVAERFRT